MFTKTLASLVALASVAIASPAAAEQVEKRLQCADAARFGGATITPTTNLKAGDTLTISANFACSFYFGINPTYTTYEALVGPSADFELPVFVASRVPDVTAEQPWDNFTVTVPDAYWTGGETYGITLWTYYEEDGPTGGSFLTMGGVGNGGLTFANTTTS